MQFNKSEFFYLKEVVMIGSRTQLLLRTNFFVLALAPRVPVVCRMLTVVINHKFMFFT